MISPDPRLQFNVAEKLARSIVAAAYAPSPILVGANKSWSPVGGERKSSKIAPVDSGRASLLERPLQPRLGEATFNNVPNQPNRKTKCPTNFFEHAIHHNILSYLTLAAQRFC